MKSRSFSLKPFPSAGLLPDLKITGSVERQSNSLSISYSLSGLLEELILPVPAEMPLRKNRLWEETCFELFLGVKGSERYWEFNLSSAGHWNVYCFTSYRQDMQGEPAFTSLQISVQRRSNSLLLSMTFELDKVIPPEQVEETLQVGISAVIKTTDGKTTYWALAHSGPQADFHHRDGFIIEL